MIILRALLLALASTWNRVLPGEEVFMKELFILIAFGVILGIIHLVFRKKEEESLEEFEEAEKEFEEKADKKNMAQV